MASRGTTLPVLIDASAIMPALRRCVGLLTATSTAYVRDDGSAATPTNRTRPAMASLPNDGTVIVAALPTLIDPTSASGTDTRTWTTSRSTIVNTGLPAATV